MRHPGLSLSLLELGAGCELEGARSAGSEGLTDRLVRLADHGAQEIEVDVRHVAGVKDIESLTDKAKFIAFPEAERLADANVLRIVGIRKVEVPEGRNRRVCLTS